MVKTYLAKCGTITKLPPALAKGMKPSDMVKHKVGLKGVVKEYRLKEVSDFHGNENFYGTGKFYFKNLQIGTRYRMGLYGRTYSGNIYLNSGGHSTTGNADRNRHQAAHLHFYEYNSSLFNEYP